MYESIDMNHLVDALSKRVVDELSKDARGDMTVAELFDLFMSERKHCKFSTKITYEYKFRPIREHFGTAPIGSIDRHPVAVWQSDLALKYSPRYVNAIIGLLSTLLAFAAEQGFLRINRLQSLKAVREESPTIDPFTLDEVQLIFAQIKPAFRSYFKLALWTGARPCEIQALRWKDISFGAKTMNVEIARVRGREDVPKTKTSKRIIPLLPPAIEALEHQTFRTGSDQHNYVFLNRTNGPITKHMDLMWKRACIRAGVRHRPPYTLRHTHASLLLAAGETPAYVAKLLGHSTTETLYRHYARFIPNAWAADGTRITARTFTVDVSRNQETVLRAGDIELNLEVGAAAAGGRIIPLDPASLKLLEVLMRHSDTLCPTDMLIEAAWDRPGAVAPSTLSHYVSQLRKAIDDPSLKQSRILSIPGHGYKLISEMADQ